MRDPIATCRALRVWRHGKAPPIRWAAENVIYHLIAIARGRTSTQLYAALDEKIEQMRAYRR
jgi:hypothetical protein